MSSNIDERIVAMKFDNKQFESGVKQTTTSLDSLKKSLNFTGATKSLDQINESAKRVSLQGISDNVDKISSRFSAMGAVAAGVLVNLGMKAVDLGTKLVKSLSLDSILEGYADYGRKLTSVQTIMNATGADIKTVSGYFGQLDTYADKTIYNLSDMTSAFAKFTNAGVGMEKSVPAIKGIANMVALAGQDAGAAAIAMYNLSQSISGGFLTTTDYKSLNLANVATKEWKDNMVAAAVAAGTLEKKGDDAYHIVGTKAGSAYTAAALFNDALSEGWASADVLLGVLGQYGDETTAIGSKAQAAAQDVKSMSMMLDTLKASAGTGWTDTFEIVVGNIEESKALFTPLTNYIGEFLSNMAEARNSMLETWKGLGGRDVLIDAIKQAFQALLFVIRPIKEAFQSLFPAVTGERLFEMTNLIHRFAEGLMISNKNFNQVKRVATGFFSAIQLGIKIVAGIIGVIRDLFGAASEGGGSLLETAAKIGDFFTNLNKSADEGNKLRRFFNELSEVLQKPVEYIRELIQWVGNLWDKLDLFAGDGASKGLDRLQGRMDSLAIVGEALNRLWTSITDWTKKVWASFEPLREAVGQFFDDLGGRLGESLKTMDFSGVLDLINTGLFAGLVLIAKKFLSGGLNVDVGGGLLKTIKGSFEELTGVMKAMQTQLKADALMKIATAIGILTLSVVALSLIDSAALTKALIAITVMFTQLAGAMAAFDKISSTGSAAKLGLLAISLGLLAGAILLLAASVKIFSTMSWEELARGFAGLTVALGLLAGIAKLLDDSSGPMLRAGIALGAVATSVLILAAAVKIFATMDWEEMGKGFAGVTAALISLALFTRLAEANKGALSGAVSLAILAGSLLIITQVVQIFADMSWEEIGKGMAGMAASLAILAGALFLMSGTLSGAAAAIIAATAVLILSTALEKFAAMSWEQIGKAATMLAGALLIIALGIAAMSVPILLVGAANILIVAAALALLGPVLVSFGKMSWESIGKGLTMLAGMFLVIGVAGALLTPVIPTLLGLGAAILLIGAGVALAGVGLLAFSAGLTALSVAGGAGALAITAIFSAIIALIPQAIAALANGIVEFAGILANSGPVFVAAMTTLLLSLITAIGNVTPTLIQTMVDLIINLVNAVVTLVPFLVEAGYRLIIGLLNGIAAQIPGVIAAGVNIIVSILNGIGAAVPRMAQAAADLIVNFLNGLATAIRNNTDRINTAGKNLANAIIEGMVKGLTGGITIVANAARDLARGALDAAKDFLGINSPSREFGELGYFSGEGYANGLDDSTKLAVKSAENMGDKAINTLRDTVSGLGSVISSEMDTTPVIRPVLDLTDVKAGTTQMASLINNAPTIAPTATYGAAASIVTDERKAQQAAEAQASEIQPVQPTQVVFNQTNNSPKALSEIDIYRQTNNQISAAIGTVKGVVIP